MRSRSLRHVGHSLFWQLRTCATEEEDEEEEGVSGGEGWTRFGEGVAAPARAGERRAEGAGVGARRGESRGGRGVRRSGGGGRSGGRAYVLQEHLLDLGWVDLLEALAHCLVRRRRVLAALARRALARVALARRLRPVERVPELAHLRRRGEGAAVSAGGGRGEGRGGGGGGGDGRRGRRAAGARALHSVTCVAPCCCACWRIAHDSTWAFIRRSTCLVSPHD